MKAYMDTGAPFSITYVTWNEKTGKGGAVMSFTNVVHHYAREHSVNAAIAKDPNQLKFATRNPNHYQNGTFNIRITAAGKLDIRTVHYYLVRLFNGMIVK